MYDRRALSIQRYVLHDNPKPCQACTVLIYTCRATAYIEAAYLRNNLAKNGDYHSGQSEPDKAGCELRHDNRQQGVHSHVAKKQRAQQEVAVRANWLNFLHERLHRNTAKRGRGLGYI